MKLKNTHSLKYEYVGSQGRGKWKSKLMRKDDLLSDQDSIFYTYYWCIVQVSFIG